jgi:uncharacterized membrane protein YfcA
MSLPHLPPEFLSALPVVLFASFLAGLARGFSGFGAALVYVPIASAALGPVVAVPILLIADVIISSTVVGRALRACSWSQVRNISIGALIGLPIGNQLLTALDPTIVRWTVTVLIFASLVLLVSGWRYRGAHTPAVNGSVGLVSGLMSGLAQIGGPPAVVYWMSSDADVARIRANLIAYFAVLMWSSLAIFVFRGLITTNIVWLGLAAAPSYALGMYIGMRMFGLASPETFRRIAVALVAAATILSVPALDPYLKWGQ